MPLSPPAPIGSQSRIEISANLPRDAHGDGAAVLLRAGHPVREAVVDGT